MRHSLAALAGLALIAGVTACSPLAPSVPAAAPAPTMGSWLGAPPAPLPLSMIPGIRVVDASGGGALPVTGRWSYVDGGSPLDAASDRAVIVAINGYRGRHGAGPFIPRAGPDGLRITTAAAAPLPAAPPGLKVEGSIVAAAGSIAGARITTSDAGRAISSTFFVDGSTGEVAAGSALLAPAAAAAAAAMITSAVSGGPAADAVPPPAAASGPPLALDSAALTDSTFDGKGNLAVTLGTGAFGAAHPETVYLSAPAVAPLLSDFGARLQRAVLSGAPFQPRTGASAHVPCSLVACVALTYDDGPVPGPTEQLLGILKTQAVPATFFEVGRKVASAPAITRQLLAAGMEISNHTEEHRNLAKLGASDILDQITRGDEALTKAGAPLPLLMRAPYGATTNLVRQTVGKPVIHWSVDSFDWRSRDPKLFVPMVLAKIAPGGVILMHDIYQTTVDGQRGLIDGLRGAGYTFVTVSQLFDGIPLQPGTIYACRGAYTPDTGVPCVGP